MDVSARKLSMDKIEKLKRATLDLIEQRKERFFEINRFLYDNPEAGYKEFKASEILMSELEKNGFKVEKNIAGIVTAFTAAVEGKPDGPTVAILAEYDALPGIGHGCGHNIIATSSIAAAVAISKIMNELHGKLIVFGTPNEEGGAEGGKIRLVEARLFRDVDVPISL